MCRIIFIINYNPHKSYYLFKGEFLFKYSSELITQNEFKLKFDLQNCYITRKNSQHFLHLYDNFNSCLIQILNSQKS